MPDIDYALLVKRLRDARGVTQEQLARELDVTVGTVNGWENARHRPVTAQRRRLRRMAESVGVQPPELEEENGSPFGRGARGPR